MRGVHRTERMQRDRSRYRKSPEHQSGHGVRLDSVPAVRANNRYRATGRDEPEIGDVQTGLHRAADTSTWTGWPRKRPPGREPAAGGYDAGYAPAPSGNGR